MAAGAAVLIPPHFLTVAILGPLLPGGPEGGGILVWLVTLPLLVPLWAAYLVYWVPCLAPVVSALWALAPHAATSSYKRGLAALGAVGFAAAGTARAFLIAGGAGRPTSWGEEAVWALWPLAVLGWVAGSNLYRAATAPDDAPRGR